MTDGSATILCTADRNTSLTVEPIEMHDLVARLTYTGRYGDQIRIGLSRAAVDHLCAALEDIRRR